MVSRCYAEYAHIAQIAIRCISRADAVDGEQLLLDAGIFGDAPAARIRSASETETRAYRMELERSGGTEPERGAIRQASTV